MILFVGSCYDLQIKSLSRVSQGTSANPLYAHPVSELQESIHSWGPGWKSELSQRQVERKCPRKKKKKTTGNRKSSAHYTQKCLFLKLLHAQKGALSPSCPGRRAVNKLEDYDVKTQWLQKWIQPFWSKWSVVNCGLKIKKATLLKCNLIQQCLVDNCVPRIVLEIKKTETGKPVETTNINGHLWNSQSMTSN